MKQKNRRRGKTNYEKYALPAYKVRPYDCIVKMRYEAELPYVGKCF